MNVAANAGGASALPPSCLSDQEWLDLWSHIGGAFVVRDGELVLLGPVEGFPESAPFTTPERLTWRREMLAQMPPERRSRLAQSLAGEVFA